MNANKLIIPAVVVGAALLVTKAAKAVDDLPGDIYDWWNNENAVQMLADIREQINPENLSFPAEQYIFWAQQLEDEVFDLMSEQAKAQRTLEVFTSLKNYDDVLKLVEVFGLRDGYNIIEGGVLNEPLTVWIPEGQPEIVPFINEHLDAINSPRIFSPHL